MREEKVSVNNPHPVKHNSSTEPAAPSLPPAPGETALSPSTAHAKPVPIARSYYKMSVVRKKAVAIVAMRAAGYTTDEIAAELKLKPSSISTYIHRATKEGFLVNKHGSMLHDPTDQVEYELAHKVVRNLNAALDDTLVTIADGEMKPVSKEMREVTLEVARGTLFKKFDQPHEAPLPSMQILAIKVDMPTNGQVQAREGTIGGVPYVDGTIEESDDAGRQPD